MPRPERHSGRGFSLVAHFESAATPRPGDLGSVKLLHCLGTAKHRAAYPTKLGSRWFVRRLYFQNFVRGAQ
jgi:hypothetical protein